MEIKYSTASDMSNDLDINETLGTFSKVIPVKYIERTEGLSCINATAAVIADLAQSQAHLLTSK